MYPPVHCKCQHVSVVKFPLKGTRRSCCPFHWKSKAEEEILCCIMFLSVRADWKALKSASSLLKILQLWCFLSPQAIFIKNFRLDCELCLKLGLLVVPPLFRTQCVNEEQISGCILVVRCPAPGCGFHLQVSGSILRCHYLSNSEVL